MTRRFMLILSGLMVLLVSANLALAKGYWDTVKISGDGLSGVIEITDPQLLDGLSFGNFYDFTLGAIPTPQVVGSGYNLRRGWDENGKFTAFDELHYFAAPTGGPGYIYYDGIVNGSSEYDKHWFRVSEQGEAAMQQIFAENDVTPADPNQAASMVLMGHEDPVNVLAWSPDGSRLASSAGWWDSKDYDVRLWSADGTAIQTLYGHSAPVQTITWSPDSTMLATGSLDGAIRLWGADGKRIDTIRVDEGQIIDLSWSPDGDSLVSISIGENGLDTIQQWSVDGDLLNTTTSDTGSIFLKVIWPEDDQYILVGGLGYHEPGADGKQIFTPRKCQSCTPYWGFAWSPSSQMWAIGNESGNVSVYRADGTWVDDLHNQHGNVDTIAWSPDGTVLAGANILWEWEHDQFVVRAAVGAGRLMSVAWSPDDDIIAITETDQNDVQVYDTNGNPLINLTGHSGVVEQLAFSPDGRLLASASADETVRLWNVESIQPSE